MRQRPTSLPHRQLDLFQESDSPQYIPPRPTTADRQVPPPNLELQSEDGNSDNSTLPTQPEAELETATTGAAPSPLSVWFELLQDERATNDRRWREMMEAMLATRPGTECISKTIPQVQPMTRQEDLRE